MGSKPEDFQYQLLHWSDDRGSAISGISIAFFSVAFLAVCLRMLARKMTGAPLGYDDFFIVIAVVLALGLMTELLLDVHHGLGKHLVRVAASDLVAQSKTALVFEITYVICHFAIKTSILLLYRRLFTTKQPRFKLAIYLVGILVCFWTIFAFLITLFQCKTIRRNWDLSCRYTACDCLPLTASLGPTMFTNTVLDVAVLVLPMPIIWRLQIQRKQKIVISGIFLLGSFACVSSIVRIVLSVKLGSSVSDSTYAFFQPLIWSVIEPCTGIVCACLPMFRPLIRRCLDAIYHLSRIILKGDTSSADHPFHTISSFTLQERTEATTTTPNRGDAPWPLIDGDSGDIGDLGPPKIDGGGLDLDRMTSLEEQIRKCHESWFEFA